MRKHISTLLTFVLLVSVLLTACGGGAAAGYKVGMVTDMGGIDDKSFNATTWKGVEDAIKDLKVEGSYLESQQQTDYATNITQFINQDTDLIVTVGFLLGDDTAKFAQENPDVNFAIVDFAYDPPIANVRGLIFNIDEAAFLAGYAAAAATKTGKVATFGGINIPPVAAFMVGFEYGVEYYNAQKGASVEVLGWNTAENNGVFVGNFESTDDGRRVAEEFLAEGADIIMPVAGPVGLGTAQAIKEHGDAWIIGVDTDWTISAPDYKDIVLTSVLKNMDVAVFDTIKMASDKDFAGFNGELFIGTLTNDGVGLADVATGASKSELNDVKDAVIKGEANTGWADYLSNM